MKLALALVAVLASSGSLPRTGTLVPGRSLGGIRLGESAAQTKATLGSFYGVCQGCARTTWYFTYAKWTRSGLAVELTGGRVSAVYTVWRPAGWRTPSGVRLGAPEARFSLLEGPFRPLSCHGYQAFVRDSGGTRTAYYVVNEKLWGFGLMRTGATPCR